MDDGGPRDRRGKPPRARTVGYEPARPSPEPAPSEPDPSADGEALLGAVLGDRYRVDAVLGHGGMATVFRCRDEQLDRDVAVKVMHDAVVADDELRGRFEREAKVLASLSHPHIVSLLDFGLQGTAPYLVMELLPGQSLGDLLADGQRLPWDRAVRLVTQLTGAVSHAHKAGVLHRDLKPDNVFLTELDTLGDHVRVLDFGFAKLGEAHGGPKLTNADRRFGTPRYLAPEQLTAAEVDARADLYAIGVIFFQMLAGERPFEGTIREVLIAKATEDPPSLAEVAPDAPTTPALEAFFRKALARRREDRFEDAAAFVAALDALVDPSATDGAPIAEPPASPAPASDAARPAPRDLAFPLLGLGAGCAVLGVVALACVGTQLLLGDDASDAPEAATEIPAEAPWAPPAPEVEAASLDPWSRPEPLAPAVAAARADVLAGLPLDGMVLRDLRRHAREHPDDLHAQLLLGHTFAGRGMRAMAVGAYERALLLDLEAAHDPRLAVDLVALASEPGEGDGPARVLRRYLPERGLEVVERALAQTDLDPRRRARLEALRDRLAAP